MHTRDDGPNECLLSFINSSVQLLGIFWPAQIRTKEYKFYDLTVEPQSPAMAFVAEFLDHIDRVRSFE